MSATDLPPAAPLEEHRFPCDTCGSDMRFDPAQALLICDHCGNVEPIDGNGRHAHAIAEQDFRAGLQAALPRIQFDVS